jgi:hypothetical protein
MEHVPVADDGAKERTGIQLFEGRMLIFHFIAVCTWKFLQSRLRYHS